MSPRSKKGKNKEFLSSIASTAATTHNTSMLSDYSKAYGLLENILQKCDKSLWTRICNVFMDTGYNVKDMCKICEIPFQTIQGIKINDQSDFIKYSKILNYVPKGEQSDYLWIFLDCWNLSTAFNRISNLMVLHGEVAPRNDQWPYKIPSNEIHEKFVKLLEEVGNDPQVYALFRMHDYDIDMVKGMLGIPIEKTDDIVSDKEFEELCQALKPEEREGALEIYCSNGRNIELTCQLLGIKRCPRKGHRHQKINLNVNRQYTRPKEHLIWPNHEFQEPAEILFQIQEHPLVVDIHYYTCAEATEAITKFLTFHRSKKTLSELRIITGKGNNSQNKSILKDHVKQLLKNMNVKNMVDPTNSGQILLSLKPLKK
uniref:Smr domain-containing protein n=1 Tax=Panagrolaimus sp. ES5 TaxID=591445 RepID=A0AC34GSV1_9BILA